MGLENLLTAAGGYVYVPSKKHRKPPKPNENSSILETQPISMVALMDPEKAREAVNLPPEPDPYEDPPKMPKFLKPDWRNKPVPKVLRGVLGRVIKFNQWMIDIALAMKENCKGQRYIDPRRFRRQFRRYYYLEKKARYKQRLIDNPPPPPPPEPDPFSGEFPRGDMVPDELGI